MHPPTLGLPVQAVHPVSILGSHCPGFGCQKRFVVFAQGVQGAKTKPVRNGEAVPPPWARRRHNVTSHVSTVNLSGIEGRLQSYM